MSIMYLFAALYKASLIAMEQLNFDKIFACNLYKPISEIHVQRIFCQ